MSRHHQRAPLRAGLIGHPVAHSLSPYMQQAAFDALGIHARYDLWDTHTSDLAARVASLRQPGMLGANVTLPHKGAVAPLLDALDPSVRDLTGVVNTIVREETPDGVRLVGHNTDMPGLMRVLDEHQVAGKGCRTLVLGAGGAAEAALAGLTQRGCALRVAARHPSSAAAVLARLWRRMHAQSDEPEPNWAECVVARRDDDAMAHALMQADVLIHATPVGTGDSAVSPLTPQQVALLPPHAFVFDMVYTPPETRLLRLAHERGLSGCSGLDMLLYQGAAAFTLWTGQRAPLDVMRRALVLA